MNREELENALMEIGLEPSDSVLVHRLFGRRDSIARAARDGKISHRDRAQAYVAALALNEAIKIARDYEAKPDDSEVAQLMVAKPEVSRRDHFAGMALQGLLASPHFNPNQPDVLARLFKDAAEAADAFIAQLDAAEAERSAEE